MRKPTTKKVRGGQYSVTTDGVPGSDMDSVIVEYPNGRTDLDSLHKEDNQNYINIHESWLPSDDREVKIYSLGLNLVPLYRNLDSVDEAVEEVVGEFGDLEHLEEPLRHYLNERMS